MSDQTDRLTRFATCADSKLESACRIHHSDADRRTARVCILIAMVGAVVFITSDYRLFGTSPKFFALLAARVAVIAASAIAWLPPSSSTFRAGV